MFWLGFIVGIGAISFLEVIVILAFAVRGALKNDRKRI